MIKGGKQFSKDYQPQNAGRKKGSLNFATEFERVYKLRKAEEIKKEMEKLMKKYAKATGLRKLGKRQHKVGKAPNDFKA